MSRAVKLIEEDIAYIDNHIQVLTAVVNTDKSKLQVDKYIGTLAYALEIMKQHRRNMQDILRRIN